MTDSGSGSFKRYAWSTLGACCLLAMGIAMGPLGILALVFCAICSAMLIAAIFVSGIRLADSLATRLGLVLLAMVNVVVLGVCLLPWIIRI